MTRKTISFPTPLARKIQKEATAEVRSFNFIAVRALRVAFFGGPTVRQSARKAGGK